MPDVVSPTPAIKLHKSAAGDVTAAAPLHESDMQGAQRLSLTAECDVTRLEAGGERASTDVATAACDKDGGKKRKVALYVAYIGAGYHVSPSVLSGLGQTQAVLGCRSPSPNDCGKPACVSL